MDDVIQKLRTPEECIELAMNALNKALKLLKDARHESIEQRAALHNVQNEVESELLKAVYAYEEVLSKRNNRRTRATRTWQMINRYGIIQAAERAVNRPIDPAGYRALVEMGLQDLTFEAVILRYPNYFREEVVARAGERLENLQAHINANHQQ